MKALVMLMSLVISATAFAADFEAMSWTQILKQGAKYDLDRSNKIHFQKASVWVFAMDADLCTDGNFIYGGTRSYDVCVGGGENGCGTIVKKKVDLVQPIVSERQRCAKFTGKDDNGCAAYETVSYVQSPNRTIKILAAGGSDDGDHQVLGTKSYTIPACSQLSPVPAN